ncbi:dephospho-CoA kinase [Enterococcus sp. LJL99]
MGMTLGLTGGIATGKSTVVKLFQEYGFPIVDSDIIAREVVEIGTPGLKAISEEFGFDILQKDGSLDRKALGTIIFSEPEKRIRLNQLLSPFLRAEITKQIKTKKQQANLVIVDIPLLYEGGYEKEVDQVAVVYVPEKIQIQRLMIRDELTKEEAEKRIASQWSIEEKKTRANIVFDNQKDRAWTKKQVTEWLVTNQFI